MTGTTFFNLVWVWLLCFTLACSALPTTLALEEWQEFGGLNKIEIFDNLRKRQQSEASSQTEAPTGMQNFHPCSISLSPLLLADYIFPPYRTFSALQSRLS